MSRPFLGELRQPSQGGGMAAVTDNRIHVHSIHWQLPKNRTKSGETINSFKISFINDGKVLTLDCRNDFRHCEES